MLKKYKLASVGLTLGAILTAFGSQKFWSAKADFWSESLVRNIGIAFYVGIGMILLSVIFFIWAGTTAGKD